MMPDKDPIVAASKAVGLLVAILTVLSIVCAAVFWIVHQNDLLVTGQALNTQAIKNNTEAIKQLNDKREQGDDNFTKLIQIMATVHNREGH
jgi:hypothetical protein